MATSPHLAASPLHRGHRAAIPRREALILHAALNHPWLLHDHLEELAETEFRHADTKKLKGRADRRIRPSFRRRIRHDPGHDPAASRPVSRTPALAAEFGKPRLCRPSRPHRADHHHALGLGRAGRTLRRADVLLTWKQLLALHRQWHSLTRELKDAELALGQDNSEANYARLRDVKSRLSTLEGTEALIEGFGDQSGRPTRSF